MKIAIKWALVAVMLHLLWLVLEFVLGFHTTRYKQLAPFDLLSLMIPVVCFYMALKTARKASNNVLYFYQGLKIALLMVAIATLLTPAVYGIYLQWINPDFMRRMTENAISRHGEIRMTVEQARADAERYFQFRPYVLSKTLIALCTYLTLGIVAAWRMQRHAASLD